MIKLEDIKVGAKVKHITHKDSSYVISDVNSRAKVNGNWVHTICYVSNYDSAYTLIRDINDFMSNFELIKENNK